MICWGWQNCFRWAELKKIDSLSSKTSRYRADYTPFVLSALLSSLCMGWLEKVSKSVCNFLRYFAHRFIHTVAHTQNELDRILFSLVGGNSLFKGMRYRIGSPQVIECIRITNAPISRAETQTNVARLGSYWPLVGSKFNVLGNESYRDGRFKHSLSSKWCQLSGDKVSLFYCTTLNTSTPNFTL